MLHLGIAGYFPLALYFAMWVAFAISVFKRPSVGVYIVTFTLPMQTGRYKIHDLPLGSNLIDILLLGTFLGLWLKGQETVPKSPINRLLLFLAVYYYFSLLEGSFFIDIPLPFWINDPRFSDWKNYVEMFVFSLAVAAALKEKKQIKLLLVFMSLSMLLVNRSFYNLMSDRDLTHFSYDVRDAGVVGYAGVNGLAALEVMFVSFLMGMYPYIKTLKLKAVIIFLIATSSYCILFAFSRGAYLAMLVVFVVLGLLRNRKLLVLVMVLLASWQVLLPTSVQERILMTTGSKEGGAALEHSAESRLVLWDEAFDTFKQNPVTGIGLFTYKYLHHHDGFRDTHNYFVKILVETGLVGFMLFITLLYQLAMIGFRLFRTLDEPFWSGIGLGFFALIVSAAVLNLFGDRWTYQQINGFLWMLLGCAIRGQLTVESKKQAIAKSTTTAIKTMQPALRNS